MCPSSLPLHLPAGLNLAAGMDTELHHSFFPDAGNLICSDKRICSIEGACKFENYYEYCIATAHYSNEHKKQHTAMMLLILAGLTMYFLVIYL